MTKKTQVQHVKRESKEIDEKDVDFLLKKVREFQEVNQRYLVNTPNTVPGIKPVIINMANTNY